METKINSMPANEIEAWEDEGGATPHPLNAGPVLMTGTESQVEWSERIRLRVNNEFDRVAAAFQAVAEKTGAIDSAPIPKRSSPFSKTSAPK